MPTMRIVIPARMKSTRLPNKPLAMIGDKTLIEHVHSKACATEFPVTVLTDSTAPVGQPAPQAPAAPAPGAPAQAAPAGAPTGGVPA